MASNMSDHNAQVMDKPLSSHSVINMTTSETLRLDGERANLHLQAAAAGGGQPYQKKKNSSFQITSITSRLSNDGGEDSADDTEDISDMMDSSKVTDFDQETPSFSEDYSKSEEVFFGPAPVIPTSSQYGITALVQQTGSGGVMTAMLPQGVTVNVTEGGIALAKAVGESDDVNHWQNRFKIVKIDSNEPFKRGRWICLDFMDSPAVTAASSVKKDDTSVVVNSVSIKESDNSENQPQTVVQLSVPVPPQSQAGQGQAQPHSVTVPPQYHVPHSSQASTPMVSSTQTSVSGVPIQSSSHLSGAPGGQGHGALPYATQGAVISGQLQPTMSQGYNPVAQAAPGQVSVHPSPSAQTPPQAQPTLPQQPLQQQPLQQPQPTPPSGQTSVQPGTLPQSSMQPASVSQPSMQQGMVPTSSIAQQPQHQPVQTQSSISQTSISSQTVSQQGLPAQGVSAGVMSQGGIPAQSMSNVISGMAQPVLTHQGVPPQATSVMNQPKPVAQSNLPQQQNVVQTSAPQQIPPNLVGSQQLSSVPTSQHIPGGQPVPVPQQLSGSMVQPGTHTQASIGSSQAMTVATPAVVNSAGVGQVSHGTHPASTPASTPAQPHLSLSATTVQAQPSSDQQASQSQQPTQPQQPPTNLEGIPLSQPVDEASNATPPAAASSQQEETESASTASTVAIDNKIEQAMDLVKSHLMFAVREEVEVLKEKITELMERISQLEYENMVLRQYATQEALQQIQQPHHSSNT